MLSYVTTNPGKVREATEYLGDRLCEGVAAVVADGETPGTESTVVDPETGTIHRRGAMAGAIAAWLDDPPVEQ